MGVDDADLGREHKLVMYVSPDLVSQFFREYSEDISKIVERDSKSVSTKISGGISSMFASIRGSSSKISAEEIIKEVNLNDEYRQVRALMNIFAGSELVYNVEALTDERDSPTGLYQFDTDLQLIPEEESDGEMIRVRGIEGDVDFTGHTSRENWSSRSFVTTALGNIDPFPFEGVFMPLDNTHKTLRETDAGYEIESLELSVKFLYILAPDTEDYVGWSNYQKLIKDHPKELDPTGEEKVQ